MIRRSRRTTRTATLFPYTTLFRSGFRARRAGAMVPPMTSLEPIPGPIHVIGGGLAGSEAAWQIARAGVPVVLHEMRPLRATAAHVPAGLAALVCSNSLRSADAETTAVGLRPEEIPRLRSLVRPPAAPP